MPIRDYNHPALTADVVLFALDGGELDVLLIRRGKPPFQGDWAFPGGFVDVGEAPRDAAARELEEETGIRDVRLEQLRAFGDPERDPRGHTVTVVYLTVVAKASVGLEVGSDAEQARWWSIDDLPSLAFDHSQILTCALERLWSQLTRSPTDPDIYQTLPESLRLGDLRSVSNAIAEALERNPVAMRSEETLSSVNRSAARGVHK